MEGDRVRMSLPSSCIMNLLSRSLAESGELDPERPTESVELWGASLPTGGATAREKKDTHPLHEIMPLIMIDHFPLMRLARPL